MAPGTHRLTLWRIPACLPHRSETSRDNTVNVKWEDWLFGSLPSPTPSPFPFLPPTMDILVLFFYVIIIILLHFFHYHVSPLYPLPPPWTFF